MPTCMHETQRSKRQVEEAASPRVRPTGVCHATGRQIPSIDRGTGRSFPIPRTEVLQLTEVSLSCILSSRGWLHAPHCACMATGPCVQFRCLKRPRGRPGTRIQGRNRHHRSRGLPSVPRSRVSACPSHLPLSNRIYVTRSTCLFLSTLHHNVLHSLACTPPSRRPLPVGSTPTKPRWPHG